METILLYHHDDYLASFDATVVEVDREAGRLVLDRTAFYPTGGHQACDHGQITKGRSSVAVVTAVDRDDDGRVRHHFTAVRGELVPGDRVTGSIDWRRRQHHMRLHTAQHIVSHWAAERLGLATGRASFSPAGGSVVMPRPLTWEELLVLEADTNQTIAERRDVVRSIGGDGVVTITVDGLTAEPCGGTHVGSTAEIELFKITAVDGKNIGYEVADRARKVALRLANAALRSATELGTDDPAELAAAARAAVARAERASEEAGRWQRRLTRMQIDAARRRAVRRGDGTTLVEADLSHLPSKPVQNLLKGDLVGSDEVWICLADRRTLLIASSSDAVDAGEVLERLRAAWNLQGAGGPSLAQGGPVPEAIDDPLTAVSRRITESEPAAVNAGPRAPR